jgi:hypothetical protein
MRNDRDLLIIIPGDPPFYSLYAAGNPLRKVFVKDVAASYLYYAQNAVVALFYTYPSFRAAHIVRNVPAGKCSFPGLTKKVAPLCSFRASRVDKLRRALGRLGARFNSAFDFPDAFYLRLAFLIEARGKLNYIALDSLARKYAGQQ